MSGITIATDPTVTAAGGRTGSTTRRGGFRIAFVLLIAGWVLLSWPWLIDGQIIPWDAKNHFYPILRFIAESLHSGQSPFWNPYHMGGYPLVSDPQSMLFSPLMVGLAALVEKPSMRLVDAAQLFHLFLGGSGVLLFCRSAGWHPAAGLVAALVFMFGGSAAGRLQHTGMILSYGYLPVALLLLKLALDRGSVRCGAAFGLVAAIMAAHRDQVAFLGCLLLIGYGVHRLLACEHRLDFIRTRWRAVAAGAALGMATLAVPLLLTFQVLDLSNRPVITYSAAATGSLAPVNFVTMLAPDYFRSISTLTDYWGPGGPAWDIDDWTDRSITYLYAGLLPVVLLVRYGVLCGWLRAREVRFFLIVLVCAVIYALGKHTPLFRPIFDHVPGVDLYRRPADATFILNFGLAMVSGYLLERLLRNGAPAQPPRVALLVAAVGAALLFAVFAMIAARHGQFPHAMKTLLSAGLGLALTAFLLRQIGRHGMRSPAWIMGAVLLLVLDLRLHNSGAVFNAQDPTQLAAFDARGNGGAVAAALRDHLDRAAERPGDRYRAEILGLGGIWQNAPMIFGIEATLGYNPLRLEAYETATGATETSHESERRFSALMPGYRSTLANLLGIRFICTTVPIERLDPGLRPGDLRLVDKIGRVRIYENPHALPRAFLAEKALPVDTAAVLRSGVLPPVDFTRTVLLDPLPAEWHMPVGTGGARPGSATITAYTNTEVKVEVRAERPAFLVLNDLYYPYWKAYVDGEETEILKANILFRAVMLPAGAHEVVFRFEPLSLGSITASIFE